MDRIAVARELVRVAKDASNYSSPEAFKNAKARMQKMAAGDFAKILAAINEDEGAAMAAERQGGENMSRVRMTSGDRMMRIEAAVSALEKHLTASDDAELVSLADEIAKDEKEVVSESVPAGKPELKDVGDQNAKANANWPLTALEKENVASKLVKLAKQLLDG